MDGLTADPIGTALTQAQTYADLDGYHALLTRIRREDPLYWATPEGYRPFWAVTKHADLCEIERQPDIFLSGQRLELFSIEQERKVLETTGRDFAVGRNILMMDGMEHRAYRGMSQGWFLPRNLRNMDQRLSELARQYVDKLAAAGGDTIDFVTEITELYPLNVILMIMGMPPEEAPKLLRLTRNFTDREFLPVPPGMTREDMIVKAAEDLFGYFAAIYEARLQQPTEDIVSVIAHAKVDGEQIARSAALAYFLLLGLAGHDTTNGTISGSLLTLIRNPGELAKLKANPELIPAAIDEMLRWVSPVNTFMRTAARDYELRGKTIKKGDGLLLIFGSANRDEEVFEDPFSFRIDRTPNPQVAFGYGGHLCLGQHLAKMELRAFFQELIPRLESAELAGEPEYVAITTAHHLHSLPVRCRISKTA